MSQKLSKLVNVYKKYGFRGFCRKLYAYVKANYLDKISFVTFFRQKKLRLELREILAGDYDRIVLWRSSFGYNVPLFQRPQHIARNLARERCLVFYEVTTMTDKIKTFRKNEAELYLFNFNNLLLNRLLMQELERVDKPKYIQVYSTDWKLSKQAIENYRARGFGFIYEYIDDLSPELAGTKELPQFITDKYDYAMSHEDVYIVVTAELLRQDVLKHRSGERVAFSSNGVDNAFFRSFDENYRFEPEFQKILDLGKPIVCYYGALAKWFDYELLKKIAATGKYSVVLFGIRYDESYDEHIHGEENIYFLGPRLQGAEKLRSLRGHPDHSIFNQRYYTRHKPCQDIRVHGAAKAHRHDGHERVPQVPFGAHRARSRGVFGAARPRVGAEAGYRIPCAACA